MTLTDISACPELWDTLLNLWSDTFEDSVVWREGTWATLYAWKAREPTLRFFTWREPDRPPTDIVGGASVYCLATDEGPLRHLQNLAIHPWHQRQGWGTRLFAALLTAEHTPLRLECEPHLLPFYARFQPTTITEPRNGFLTLVFTNPSRVCSTSDTALNGK